ncbi:MAG TPA: endonuclease Q family protein [Candidatus Woesebacteria bacterium]|nr:endonuclease Q family protein [Candidatus Woesebacteria bacterium]
MGAMELVADLHLHSKYSRAVSPRMNILEMASWAEKKGINLLGTGDWTHPLWLKELKELLEENDGILRLKAKKKNNSRSEGVQESQFLLSAEISSIYHEKGKLRRIHNLVFAPSFAAVDKIIRELKKRGANLDSDGRPIIGLSAKNLGELVFTADKECLLIPAHIWTPWFSLYGSKSGFDSIEDCLGPFAENIFAVETGISSDPAMNWRISELDNRSILSFSDAHSPEKMGREATVFEVGDITRLRYGDIKEAIVGKREVRDEKLENKAGSEISRNQNSTFQNPTSHFQPHISCTIEFYPEEGKYHYTGHRSCRIRQSPEETKRSGETCPVCGKPLTVGVMHRVEQLASRSAEEVKGGKFEAIGKMKRIQWGERPSYVRLVPLMEILSESLGSSVGSQKVVSEFDKLTVKFGSEFKVLLETPLEEIAEVAGGKVAEGVGKVRQGKIVIEPGYDGVFGTVKIWSSSVKTPEEENGFFENEVSENGGQMSIFEKS